MAATLGDEPSPSVDRDLVDAALQAASDLHEETSHPPGPGSSARQSPSRPLPESFEGYEITREIHRGGQGVVYQGIQKSTKRKVAIKILHDGALAKPRELARFDREVQILVALNHPNIVNVYDSGEAAGQSFFVMDYISGKPLDVYMAGGNQSINQKLELFGKICEAVNAAHLRGVIHRDLKPSNIQIDANGDPHILDFGLAKFALGDATDNTRPQVVTITGQFMGSLPWASPEQAGGSPDQIDVRTDVYSLGVVLFQMLTGKFPYNIVANMSEVLDNIIRAQPAKPSTIVRQINDEIDTIVLKSLSKEPERRYQNAGELRRDISHYLSNEPIDAKRDSGWYVLKKSIRRYKLPIAAAGAIALSLFAGAVVSTWFAYQATQARDEARHQAALAQEINDFLNEDLLGSVSPEEQGREVMMREVLDAASKAIEGKFPKGPLIEASIRLTLGNTYNSLGEYKVAEAHLERAVELRRNTIGQDHPETLSAEHAVARVYFYQGRSGKAKPLILRTLEQRRRVLGDEHPDTLASMNILATVLMTEGKYHEAESLYQQTLDIQHRVLGDEHPETLASMHNLAVWLLGQRKYAQAETLSRKTLAIQRRVLGEEHVGTLRSVNNLAAALQNQRRFAEAETLYKETLEIQRRVLGDEHPDTLLSMSNRAAVLVQLGRYRESETLSRQTLEIQRRIPADEHLTLAVTKILAKALQYQGEYGEAAILFRQVLEIQRRKLGDEDAETVMLMNDLAAAFQNQGKYGEAEKLSRQTLEIRRRVLGDDDPLTLMSMNNLAMSLLSATPADPSKLEAALRLAQQAVDKTASKNPSYLDTLALAYQMTGNIQHAVETQQEALDLLPNKEGFVRNSIEASLIKYLRRQGDLSRVEQLHRDILARRRKDLPTGAPATTEALCNLSTVLIERDNYTEAEPTLLDCHKSLKNNPDTPPATLNETVTVLVQLYDSMGDPTRAAEWRANLPSHTNSDASASE